MTDYSFAGRADGLWDGYDVTSATPELTGTLRGRPYRCEPHSSSIDMLSPAHFYGDDNWLRARSARTGVLLKLGSVTTPGTVRAFGESYDCTYTDDDTVMSSHDGWDDVEGAGSRPTNDAYVAPDRRVPFLARVRYGGNFLVNDDRTVRVPGGSAGVTVVVHFRVCPRGGRDVARCD